MKNDLVRLKEQGLVAVVRGVQFETAHRLVEALMLGGISIIEITVDAPRAIDVIKDLATRFGDEILLGAGTVMDGETARMAILAGAQFIVSPSLHPDVITVSKRYGKIVIPGGMTPTEIVKGYELGADMIKVFPASILGPGYIKDIRGPLGHIPLMTTGGIDLHNIADFIKAGVDVVGVGGSLVSRQMIQEGKWELITEKARQLVEEVQRARKTN